MRSARNKGNPTTTESPANSQKNQNKKITGLDLRGTTRASANRSDAHGACVSEPLGPSAPLPTTETAELSVHAETVSESVRDAGSNVVHPSAAQAASEPAANEPASATGTATETLVADGALLVPYVPVYARFEKAEQTMRLEFLGAMEPLKTKFDSHDALVKEAKLKVAIIDGFALAYENAKLAPGAPQFTEYGQLSVDQKKSGRRAAWNIVKQTKALWVQDRVCPVCAGNEFTASKRCSICASVDAEVKKEQESTGGEAAEETRPVLALTDTEVLSKALELEKYLIQARTRNPKPGSTWFLYDFGPGVKLPAYMSDDYAICLNSNNGARFPREKYVDAKAYKLPSFVVGETVLYAGELCTVTGYDSPLRNGMGSLAYSLTKNADGKPLKIKNGDSTQTFFRQSCIESKRLVPGSSLFRYQPDFVNPDQNRFCYATITKTVANPVDPPRPDVMVKLGYPHGRGIIFVGELKLTREAALRLVPVKVPANEVKTHVPDALRISVSQVKPWEEFIHKPKPTTSSRRKKATLSASPKASVERPAPPPKPPSFDDYNIDTLRGSGIPPGLVADMILSVLRHSCPGLAEYLTLGVDGNLVPAGVPNTASEGVLKVFEVIAVDSSDSEGSDDEDEADAHAAADEDGAADDEEDEVGDEAAEPEKKKIKK